MKSATLYVNGRNRTIEAGDHGTFYFTLDTRYKDSALSLYAKPEIGYKLKGVYSTGTGSLLSTKTTWHFTPAASGYSIRFTLNPDSYKYTLQPGDASDAKLPYIQAAAKRLEELGYYSPSVSYVSSASMAPSTQTVLPGWKPAITRPCKQPPSGSRWSMIFRIPVSLIKIPGLCSSVRMRCRWCASPIIRRYWQIIRRGRLRKRLRKKLCLM